jgi:hypothetical protein
MIGKLAKKYQESPIPMSTVRSAHACAMRSLAAGLILSLAAGPALADDIDWVTALKAYYTAQVVYDRCGFHATWEQLNALNESIDDAERESALANAERILMKEEIEDEARSDESTFCEENGRRLMSPDFPE